MGLGGTDAECWDESTQSRRAILQCSVLQWIYYAKSEDGFAARFDYAFGLISGRPPLSSIASAVSASRLGLNESIFIRYFCLSTFPLLASTKATKPDFLSPHIRYQTGA
jgi:hypothetical protein